MLQFFKNLFKLIPIAITQNQKYDRDTLKVFEKVCKYNSNCIDVGCHKGEILDHLFKFAPEGSHFAFEPLPHLYADLVIKYQGKKVTISNVALSDTVGTTNFNYVVSNPAYSGIKKRTYDRPNEVDQTIEVQLDTLDRVVGLNTPITLIKIDVEGAEYQVLNGAKKLLATRRPFVIFEHGKGASDHYGTTPNMIFELFSELNYSIQTMKGWLNNQNRFTKDQFELEYEQSLNYYFIAYPLV